MNSQAAETKLSDLIAFARQNPGKLRIGSYGIGTQSHLAAHWFNKSAGIDTVHVPYRGGAPLVGDLLGNHIHVAFDTVSSSLPHIRAGALRALAVTTADRLGALPEVPSANETLPGYEIVVWIGIAVRKGTSADIAERLNAEVNRALADPAIGTKFSDLSMDSAACSLEACGAFWSEDIERTLGLVRKSGLKLE
jgi:tripartite-type tricarboxylate transporter receptor subunit TctC